MRADVGKHRVEVRPAFRTGKGRATNVAISVPLRAEDLVSILYHSRLNGSQLRDADAVREAIADVVLNRGGNRIQRDKLQLQADLAHDRIDTDRLSTCRRRVATLFGPDTRGTSARANRDAA
ncbi:hypothetical protein [Actinopolyspora halophila]|uniref:hypothetical protein n=1 Tax=Actinopolyspora halophila TaxID=1850 RepID=UPI000365FBF0|nr:hypothetical protein [Actinopolyspora halophila]